MRIKLLSKTILGILLFGFSMTAYAAPDLKAGIISSSIGGTITVPISFTNTAAGDVVATDFQLDYDERILTLTSVDSTALGGNISNYHDDSANGVITFLFANSPIQAISSGDIVVNFKIQDNASPDTETTLALNAVTFSNSSATSIPPGNITNGSLAISASIDGSTEVASSGSGVFSLWEIFFFLLIFLFMSKKSRIDKCLIK